MLSNFRQYNSGNLNESYYLSTLYKLVSAVADGPRDADLCPLKSCQPFHETEPPQTQYAMLMLGSTGREGLVNRARYVYRIERRQSRRGRSTVAGAINKARRRRLY